MGRKILVVVDYQYDFFSPDGALYVNGGEKLQEKIANIIPNFDHVIFTLDCHPINHCSFKENGGQWPIHCVSYTIGAGLPVEFLEKTKSSSFQPKGMIVEQEEYGAFNSFMELMLDLDYDNKLNFNLHNTPEIIKNTVVNNIDELVICGIAGDYCVVETLKNIVKHIGNDKVSVFLDGVVSIDDGKTLNTYMKENNIKTYKD